MNCPYCSKEMEKGYIDQTDFLHNLRWYPANRGDSFFVSTKRDVKLTASLKSGSITAYRCEDCKKIIIDENTLDV